MEVTIKTWAHVLGQEKEKPYFKQIMHHLEQDRKAGKIIYPPQPDIFNALKLTPYDQVKVVIIGQDPYHGPHQAHGLSFSVKHGVPPPPSLENIYKELASDLGIPRPKDGCLEKWAKQGVLLLNASLTVLSGQPQSHADIGWHTFTDKVIESLNDHPETIVYLLWGSYAQKKEALIDTSHHKILKAPHPSPLSAHRGFLGCKHFSKANALLKFSGRDPIDWSL
ncbi:MAG TPA: uracil-DNA glycosylase [Coxiellaceae bacterium]|nr:uracil-DNA glycosylase [Coxiellaceae bacterium]